MDIFNAVDAMEDDVLKSKCHKAIAAIQRTLDLYGCACVPPTHALTHHANSACKLSTMVRYA